MTVNPLQTLRSCLDRPIARSGEIGAELKGLIFKGYLKLERTDNVWTVTVTEQGRKAAA